MKKRLFFLMATIVCCLIANSCKKDETPGKDMDKTLNKNVDTTLDKDVDRVANPVMNPPSKEYSQQDAGGTITVAITCATAGATIYYTTDGSDPSRNSKVYETPLVFTKQSVTLKAFGAKEHYLDSYQVTEQYTYKIILTLKAPVFNPGSQNFEEDMRFTIQNPNPNADQQKIYFTRNGSDPDAKSEVYTESIYIKSYTRGEQFKFRARVISNNGEDMSPVSEAIYTQTAY